METWRKESSFCGQELAHAAFYRHLSDQTGSICPGKYQHPESLDSTFDFGSSSDTGSDAGSNTNTQEMLEDPVPYDDSNECTGQSQSFSETSMSSEVDLSEDGEIWETSDEDMSDREDTMHDESAQSSLLGMSVFLKFFQLFFFEFPNEQCLLC